MPAFIGGVKLISVGNGGQFQVGDAGVIVPKSRAKTYMGSGASNTGDVSRTFSLLSTTNTIDQDLSDSNIASSF